MSKQYRIFGYSEQPHRIKRIDFDRPVKLLEVRIGNSIVALDETEQVHEVVPTLAKISQEERSRYTFETPMLANPGTHVGVLTDRSCTAQAVSDTGSISLQFEAPVR